MAETGWTSNNQVIEFEGDEITKLLRTMGEPILQVHVSAADLAEAWVYVWQAGSEDKEDPTFYRRTLIEWYPTGVQLVCASGRKMFRAFVPILGSDGTRGRSVWEVDDAGVPLYADTGVERTPDRHTVVSDPDARTINLLKHVAKVAKAHDKDNEADPLGFTLELRPAGNPDAPALLPEMEGLDVHFRAHTGETVPVRVSEAGWLDWRALYLEPAGPEGPTSMLDEATLLALARLKMRALVERHGTSWWLAGGPVLGVIQSKTGGRHDDGITTARLMDDEGPDDFELEELERAAEEAGD